MPSNPRRPSRGQEFDVAHAMRTFLKQMASDAFRSAPRSLRSSAKTPMMPEPPNWFHLVDHCNRNPRRRQGTGNGDLQAAGRFDNHQVSGLKSPSQLADSGLSLATERLSPFGQIATPNCALAPSIPTNRFASAITAPHHAVAQPCNPGFPSLPTVRA
jgi:hypothetical protein